jgi:hypothetical protein
MEEQQEMVTVYRSADMGATDEAAGIRSLLTDAGIAAEIFDDKSPGVPSGAYEVRVPPGQVTEAEALIAAAERGDSLQEELDPSHERDLYPVFLSNKNDAEMEALAVKALLDSNGIDAMIVGSPQIPSLTFEVRVPKDQVDQARQVIADAKAGGFAAAEEAEQESEGEAPLNP